MRSENPSERTRAFGRIAEVYWKPAYKYLRARHGATDEEAQDLIQGFLLAAFERGLFARYEPERAAFRTWFRLLLDGHVGNERKSSRRQKRGGGVAHRSFDFVAAEDEMRSDEPAAADDFERYFEREWTRHLLGLAVEDLRAESERDARLPAFRAFCSYDLCADPKERPTYRELADRLEVPVTTVTNWLHQMRRAFRQAVLSRLRELCSDDDEFRTEARAMLGSPP